MICRWAKLQVLDPIFGLSFSLMHMWVRLLILNSVTLLLDLQFWMCSAWSVAFLIREYLKSVDVEFLCLNYSQDMNDCAVYAASSPGITTLAQLVCAGFPSIWGKRRLLSVCIVVVEAVQVEIDCYFMWAFFFYATTFLLIWSPGVAFVVVTNVVLDVEKDTRTATWRRMRLLLYLVLLVMSRLCFSEPTFFTEKLKLIACATKTRKAQHNFFMKVETKHFVRSAFQTLTIGWLNNKRNWLVSCPTN
jgi:hypothetical protein